MSDQPRLVMPGPSPGTHDFIGNSKDVDGRNKSGHDGWVNGASSRQNSDPDGRGDQTDKPVPIYLRRLDEKADRIIERLDDLSQRATSLELKTALLHNDFARQSERIDQIELRRGRIERRLDIVGAVE